MHYSISCMQSASVYKLTYKSWDFFTKNKTIKFLINAYLKGTLAYCFKK